MAKDNSKLIMWGIVIVVAILILGPRLGMFSVATATCEKPYTVYLNQTLTDRFGENEHVYNPYLLSCADLKRNYCMFGPTGTPGSGGSWDSSNDICTGITITQTCDQLFQLACSGSFFRLDSVNTCTQIDNETAWNLLLSGNYPSNILSSLKFPMGNYNGTIMIIDSENDACQTLTCGSGYVLQNNVCVQEASNLFTTEVFKIGTFSVQMWMIIALIGGILLIVLLKK